MPPQVEHPCHHPNAVGPLFDNGLNRNYPEHDRGNNYQGIQVGDSAQAQIGDRYQQYHGITINAGRVDLNDAIFQQLAQLKQAQPPRPKTFGLCLGQAPQIEKDAFIGRTAELQQLREWFPQNSGNQEVVSIVGMGGLGKTQLSLNYAREFQYQYTSVFWVNAKDELSLRQSFLSLASTILVDSTSPIESTGNTTGREQIQVDSVRRWLSEEWNKHWLLIFDNYDDPNLPNIRSNTGFDIRSYFPHRAQGHILITTRFPKLTFSKKLLLQKFNDVNSSISILAQRAGRDLSTEANARTLAVRLDGLPLALATAGVYLGQTNVSCTEYLQEYESAWSDLHSVDSGELFEYEERTMSSTWIMSFDQVRRTDDDAAELLKFWVYFSNKDIWHELIQNGADGGPAWMSRLTTSKIRFNRAMTKLQDYSLAEVTAGTYSIHTCVHTWISEYFGPSQVSFDTALKCAVKGITDLTSTQYWTGTRRLLGHLKRLGDERFRTLWDESMSDYDKIQSSFTIANVLLDWDHLDEAEAMYVRAFEGYKRVSGPDHMSTLDAANNLGMLYADQGCLPKAEELYKRALTGYEAQLRPEDPAILNTLNNLGVVYYREGKLDQADEILQRAIAGLRTELGHDHSSTMCTLNNLGLLYRAQGKLEEAEQTHALVVTGMEKLNGHSHPSTLQVIHNLGLMKKDRGKLDEAETLFTQALRGYEKILGHDHALALDTVYDLGKLYHAQGRLEDANALFSRVISSVHEDGRAEPRTAKCIRGLAAVLSVSTRNKQHDLQAARDLVGRLVHLAEGNGWKGDAAIMYYLARCLFWAGDQPNALFAFCQDTTAQCDGCGCRFGLETGHNVCCQCDDADLCNECAGQYKDKSLEMNGSNCNGHEYFDVGAALPESLKSFKKFNQDEVDAWIEYLRETYPLRTATSI